jgi:hypothetical protein
MVVSSFVIVVVVVSFSFVLILRFFSVVCLFLLT